jgi:hypothetical protein
VLQQTRFVDADASGTVTAGDVVELTFDMAVVLQGADPARDLALNAGDTAGAGATLQASATPQVVQLVLGTGAVLSVTGTYLPGRAPGPGASPARLGLSVGALPSAIVSLGGVGARLGDPPLLIALADQAAYPALQGRTYTVPAPADANPYWGNLHAHTGFSNDSSPPGDADPDVAWAYARDVAQIDFMAVTDHLDHLDATEWSQTLAFAAGEQRANFVALTGYEWNIGKNAAGTTYNHINVIGATTLPVPGDTLTLADFYSQALLLNYPQGAVAQWNHPSFAPLHGLDDWDDFAYDAEADKLVTLATAQTSGSNDTPDIGYIPGLDLGWHLAPTSNQDNHRGEWGDKTSRRAGVWLDTVSPAETLLALREGRVFSTSDPDAAARLLAAGGVWMGSTVTDAGPVALRVEFSDGGADAHSAVELYTTGGTQVQSTAVSGPSGFVEFVVDPAVDAYYYAIVRQTDGSSVLTAPIYVDR